MTTTELIKMLKEVEFGASLRPREVSLRVNDEYIYEPILTLDSTGDGIAGAEVCIRVDAYPNL